MTWLELSPLHVKVLPWGVFDLEPDLNDPHRREVFQPPFFGFDFPPVHNSNFTFDREHILSSSGSSRRWTTPKRSRWLRRALD